jgi:hypothetical protein
MALNFPNNPSLNETYTGSNGLIYKWDGTKWITQGSDNATGGKVEEAPEDGTVYGRVDANWQDISTTHLPLTGGTLTGGLTGTTLDATTSVSAPIVTATDHMEGVGEHHLVSFTGDTEVELTIPAWATRIELNVGQVVSSTLLPFEIVVKKGTGTDYGTVTSINSFNSWVNDSGAVAVAGGAAPYLRVFFNYFPAATYVNRGVGTIYLDDLGGGIYNMTASVTGIGHIAGTTAGAGAAVTNYIATGFGNVDAKPTVLGFKCPAAGQANRINVTFYA